MLSLFYTLHKSLQDTPRLLSLLQSSTSHCLVLASNSGHSPSSGFPNCLRPQLPACNRNRSQLKPSVYLTHSLIPYWLHYRIENIVPLLQWNCYLAVAWHIPPLCLQPSAQTVQKTPFLFCFTGHYLVISRSLPNEQAYVLQYFHFITCKGVFLGDSDLMGEKFQIYCDAITNVTSLYSIVTYHFEGWWQAVLPGASG
jgi:hypothetical protein